MMAGQAWTYSSRKPLRGIKQGPKRKGSDVLFDEIFPAGNVFDDSYNLNKHQHQGTKIDKSLSVPTRKRKQKGKHKQISPVCEVEESAEEKSVQLYECCERKQKKKIKEKKSSHVKEKAATKSKRKRRNDVQTRNNNENKISDTDSTAQSDDQDYYYQGFVVEESKPVKGRQCKTAAAMTKATKATSTRVKKGRNPISHVVSSQDKQSSLTLCDSGVTMHKNDSFQTECPSIEIPRRSTEPSFLLHRDLLRSPMSPLVMSNDDLLSSFEKPKLQKTGTGARMVTVSSRYDDSLPTSSELQSLSTREASGTSEYTCTYISTYTDGTSCATGSTKTTGSSPPVTFKQLQRKLNSTTYKDKDNIGVLVFPDSISPICQRGKENTPNIRCSDDRTILRKYKKKKHTSHESKRHPPKCSTKLFDTDSIQTQGMEHFDITSIHNTGKERETVCTEGLSMQKEEAAVTINSQKEQGRYATSSSTGWSASFHIKGVNREAMKFSTPVTSIHPLSFNLSPIALPNLNDSELGLQINEGRETNSDEILVPSLMTPTVLPGDSTWNKECMNYDKSPEKESDKKDDEFNFICDSKSKKGKSKQNTEKQKLDYGNSLPPNKTHDVNGNLDISAVNSTKKKHRHSFNADTNSNITQTEGIPCQNIFGHGADCIHMDFNENPVSPLLRKTVPLKPVAKICPSKIRTKKKFKVADFVKRNDDNADDAYREANSFNGVEGKETRCEDNNGKIRKAKCTDILYNPKNHNYNSVCFINELCMQTRTNLLKKYTHIE